MTKKQIFTEEEITEDKERIQSALDEMAEIATRMAAGIERFRKYPPKN